MIQVSGVWLLIIIWTHHPWAIPIGAALHPSNVYSNYYTHTHTYIRHICSVLTIVHYLRSMWVTLNFLGALRSPWSWRVGYRIPRIIMVVVFSWNLFRFSTSILALVWDWLERAENLFQNWGSSIFSLAFSVWGNRPYFWNRTSFVKMPLYYHSTKDHSGSWLL